MLKRWLTCLCFASALALGGWAAWAADGAGEVLPAPPAASESGIEGRVIAGGKALPGARAYVYNSYADYTAFRPLAVSAPTGGDGKYRLPLTPGSYYLVAKKRAAPGEDGPVAPGDFFAFQGSNPIAVHEGRFTHVGFAVQPVTQSVRYEPSDDPDAGSLAGVVTFQGKPVDGVYVTLYMDTLEDMRGMTYASSPPTGKEGRFRFDSLPDSELYVIARKRASGRMAGPLADGDFFGFLPQNPVVVKAGKVALVELPLIEKTGGLAAEEGLYRDLGTAIRGRVLDKEGKPARGVYAFAYVEKVMGHNRPGHLSQLTDKEGRYTIYLPQGGTYYIGARSDYGDTPALGEWYGRWEGAGDHSVRIETGKTLENIDMVVEKILP